jgi:hypothetical protein
VNLLLYNVKAGRRNLKHCAKVKQKVKAEEGLVDRDYSDRANVYNYSQIIKGWN